MRFRVMAFGLLLPLSLAWSGLAVGQTLEDRVKSLEAQVERLLTRAIILTDQECVTLGADWKPYEAMGGRFPIGVGTHTDPREETRTFAIDDYNFGTYSHQLTEPEMPFHTHSFVGSRGSLSVDDWDNEWGYREHRRETGPAGGDLDGETDPHNNMPPYRVVNFCHKTEALN